MPYIVALFGPNTVIKYENVKEHPEVFRGMVQFTSEKGAKVTSSLPFIVEQDG